MKLAIAIFLLLTFIGPLWVLISGQIDFSLHWQTADRSSAHIAANPRLVKEAVIQVYSARAFNWRGIISTHVWIATKRHNAEIYNTYQVIGWRQLAGLPSLVMQEDVPDRMWFGQKPTVICDIRGAAAEQLIDEIEAAAKKYPYADYYETWPGPNSNTFIAYIGREVPGLKLVLPGNAVGKDYFPMFHFFAKTPSGTGYQFSVLGVFGILIAAKEGVEINFLGLVYGFNPMTLTLKLPGIEIGAPPHC